MCIPLESRTSRLGQEELGLPLRDIVEGLNLHEFDPSSIPVGNPPVVNNIIWEALAKKFVNSWMHSVHKVETSASVNGGKLSMYRQFKHCPDTEPYVRASLPVGVRRVVAGLRAGCLPLQMELGRYTSPKTPLSRCICNNGVEDQEHFLLLCPSLIEPRAKLFNQLHFVNPSFSAFILTHSSFCLWVH